VASVNNKANPYYATENHIRLAKRDMTKAEIIPFSEDPQPAAPAALTWELLPGSEPGTVTVHIISVGDPGDGPAVGDGLGELIGSKWRVFASGIYTILDGGDGPGFYNLPAFGPDRYGLPVTIELAPIGYNGRTGAVSSHTATVPGEVVALPANVTPPSITGSAVIGQILTANDGVWSGSPTPTITRVWFLNDTLQSTDETFVAQSGTIILRVTATNSVGAVSADVSLVIETPDEVERWLMAMGLWDDTGEWDDEAVWID
jgi:hypothetical protein